MLTDWTKLVAVVTDLAPRYLAALAFMSAILLFTPQTTIEWLALGNFAATYRPWIAMVFIGSTVVFTVNRGVDLIGWALAQRSLKSRCETRLNSMTGPEQAILRHYFAYKTRSNSLRAADGVVAGLVSCGVIYQASTESDPDGIYAFNISDTAWAYLQKNHEKLLGDKSAGCRDDRQDAIRKANTRRSTDYDDRLDTARSVMERIAREVQSDKDVPWIEQSSGALRALLAKEIFNDYEAILKKENPRQEAGIFLKHLVNVLTISHLRT